MHFCKDDSFVTHSTNVILVAPDLIYELGFLLGALATLAAWVDSPLQYILYPYLSCLSVAPLQTSQSNFDPLVITHKESLTLLKCRILFPTIYGLLLHKLVL